MVIFKCHFSPSAFGHLKLNDDIEIPGIGVMEMKHPCREVTFQRRLLFALCSSIENAIVDVSIDGTTVTTEDDLLLGAQDGLRRCRLQCC